jgi:hypothetical protein
MNDGSMIDRTTDLLAACRAYAGGAPDETLRAATRAFVEEAPARPDALVRAREGMSSLPIAGASWLAIVLGTAVERGSDPTLTGEAVWSTFARWIDALSSGTPEREAIVASLPKLSQSVVAHLARMPARRAALAEDTALRERLRALEEESHGILWVTELLSRVSGTLIVLHPTSGVGARLRYENVSSCFHLFSLVQTAVGTQIEGGRPAPPAILAALHGEPDGAIGDEALWHYGDPRSNAPSVSGSVWGESAVRDLPRIDGEQVLILWPRLLGGRKWDAGFFGPALDALPATATYERPLSPEEASAWFARLGIDAARR